MVLGARYEQIRQAMENGATSCVSIKLLSPMMCH
jgi:hypothetical protein